MDKSILNVATPTGGILFSRDKIDFGDIFASIYALTKYPNNIAYGWLNKITGLNDVVSCQIFEPINADILMKNLSESVKTQEAIAGTTRDELTRQRALRTSEDAKILMRQVDNNAEIIGYMSNLAMIMGKDEEDLKINRQAFQSRVATIGCNCRNLSNQQKEGLQAIAPWGVPDESILQNARRNVPLSTFLGGFPFSSNGLSDDKGLPFGIDSSNGLIVLDLWKREEDRTNQNGIIVGVTGVGKSTAVKLLMTNEFMLGTKIIAIDPEREYSDLTLNLGGDLIQAGGGGFKINPLEFSSMAYKAIDDEDRVDFAGFSPLALHLNNLETFFKLYQPSLTDMQISILKQLLEGLYFKFNIEWETDTSDLQSSEYPIFSDLYHYCLDLEKDNTNEHTNFVIDQDNLNQIKITLRELALGGDRYLFNGHTTVKTKSGFISIDTSLLQDMSERVKKAQYFNLLTWAWKVMSSNKDERVLLFCDEAYLLCDPQVPQSLKFLRNVAKRARKYEAGLWVITHSAVDFLHDNVKEHGQALFDLPTFKILMGTDGQNLIEMTRLFNLTEAEQDRLRAKKRSEAILFVGAKHIGCKVKVSNYKLKLMGSGGGR